MVKACDDMGLTRQLQLARKMHFKYEGPPSATEPELVAFNVAGALGPPRFPSPGAPWRAPWVIAGGSRTILGDC